MPRLIFLISLAATLLALLCSSGCNVAATGHNIQGRRLYEQGRFADALNTFQKALRSNPRSADAYYNMAATYYFLGKQHRNAAWMQQADTLYRHALNLDPSHKDAHRGLAVMLVESGRAQDATQMLQNWRLREPGSAEPIIELARLQKELGQRDQASQLLIDALNVDSSNARALKAMGQMREEDGQLQLALDNYIRSYQANNLQTDVAAKIAALQGRIRSPSVPVQPGQSRMGSVNQYVPR